MAGQVYHVTTTTLGRRPLFADYRVACIAARSLSDRVIWRDAKLLCWSLMPDHWHALIQLCDGGSISAVVNRVKSISARAINRHLRTEGGIWARAFHDHALRADEDLVSTARYILANPIRAGIADSLRRYPFWDAVWLSPELEVPTAANPAVAVAESSPVAVAT